MSESKQTEKKASPDAKPRPRYGLALHPHVEGTNEDELDARVRKLKREHNDPDKAIETTL